MSTPNDNTPPSAATDDKGTGGGQGAAGAGAGDKSGAGTGGGQGTATPPQTYTKEELDAAEERGRKAARAEAQRKEDEDKLSEEERYKRRAEDAETKLRVRDAQDGFETAAREAGATNPSKVYRLYKDEIEFDDKGKPTNLKELVARAKREYGDEFGTRKPSGSADGGAGRSSGTSRSMNDLIRGRK